MTDSIDWATFWATHHTDEDWLCDPILPRGRAIVTYSPPKEGKSDLAIDTATRLAQGHRTLDTPPGPPNTVVYLDYEMGEADLRDRFEDMHYGPLTDLSHLYYYALPDLPPLDTRQGGHQLLEIATQHHPDLVVIDTLTAALGGPENDADTFKNYWRHTGGPLKDQGVTVWRLDHSGKDPGRGQRGSSHKAGDVDLVWELTRQAGDQALLKATHRRLAWTPAEVHLVRLEAPTRFELTAGPSYPEGTYDAATWLDKLDAPLDITRRAAGTMLRTDGWEGRNETVMAAIRWRRVTHHEPDHSWAR